MSRKSDPESVVRFAARPGVGNLLQAVSAGTVVISV
jgi:hypothetical protein